MSAAAADLTDTQYRELLAFRTALRRFTHWSESQAIDLGLTAAQHQLMLAVRGHPDPRGPTIGDVADSLLLRHHSAVGLVDRAAAANLVERRSDPADQRIVRLRLTALGARRLRQLSHTHLAELRRTFPKFGAALFADAAGIEIADMQEEGER